MNSNFPRPNIYSATNPSTAHNLFPPEPYPYPGKRRTPSFSGALYRDLEANNQIRNSHVLMELDQRHTAHQNHLKNMINESIQNYNERNYEATPKREPAHLCPTIPLERQFHLQYSHKKPILQGPDTNYGSIIIPKEKKRTISVYTGQSNSNPQTYGRFNSPLRPSENFLREYENFIPNSPINQSEIPQPFIKETNLRQKKPYETIFRPTSLNGSFTPFNERRKKFQLSIGNRNSEKIKNDPYINKVDRSKNFYSDLKQAFNSNENPFLSEFKIKNETTNKENMNLEQPLIYVNNQNLDFNAAPTLGNRSNYQFSEDLNNRQLNNYNDNPWALSTENKSKNTASPFLNDQNFIQNNPQSGLKNNKMSKIDKTTLPLIVQDFLILIDYDREIEIMKSLIRNEAQISLYSLYEIIGKPLNSLVDCESFVRLIQYFCPAFNEKDILFLMKRFLKSETPYLKFYDIIELFCIKNTEYRESTKKPEILIPAQSKQIFSNYIKLLMTREKEHMKFRLSISHNQNALEIFKEIDQIKKGYIVSEDLRFFLHSFEIYCNQTQLSAIMKIYNKSNSGRINYNEFLNEINF